jgi:hypothetical protein
MLNGESGESATQDLQQQPKGLRPTLTFSGNIFTRAARPKRVVSLKVGPRVERDARKLAD